MPSINNFNSILAALAFYTCCPIPANIELDFTRIARWASLIGVLLGGALCLVDLGLERLEMPIAIRSSLIVAIWLWWTGGLHLDGAMDAADGLAVQDPTRRLAVMSDSVTGAFGAIVAVVIILLKTCALTAISHDRAWALVLVAGWSRWGQVVAIARYPYLKADGKGAFHRQGMILPNDIIVALMPLLLVAGCQIYLQPQAWSILLLQSIVGCGVAVAIGSYFNGKFGGHTGDTYGAVVEWTEAITLTIWTIWKSG